MTHQNEERFKDEVSLHLSMFIKLMVGEDNFQEITMKIVELEAEKFESYCTDWKVLHKRAIDLDSGMHEFNGEQPGSPERINDKDPQEDVEMKQE